MTDAHSVKDEWLLEDLQPVFGSILGFTRLKGKETQQKSHFFRVTTKHGGKTNIYETIMSLAATFAPNQRSILSTITKLPGQSERLKPIPNSSGKPFESELNEIVSD